MLTESTMEEDEEHDGRCMCACSHVARCHAVKSLSCLLLTYVARASREVGKHLVKQMKDPLYSQDRNLADATVGEKLDPSLA